MNQFRILLSTLLIFGSLNAFAYIHEKVFQLTPNFHQLFTISENAEGQCAINNSKSIRMDQYNYQYLDQLTSAKLVIKPSKENGYFVIQILAETANKPDAIRANMIGNAWVVDSIVNQWTRANKTQHFMITKDQKCVSKSVLLVKDLNVTVH